MSSDKRGKSNTNKNLVVSDNSNDSDIDELSLNGTGQAEAACEVRQFNGSGDKSLQRQIKTEYLVKLCEISERYEIQPEMIEHLRELENFEIVIVVDDSGSMGTPVDGSQRTRWDELCVIIKVVIEISVVFDSNGIDIYFINGRTFHKVKDPTAVDELFKTPPTGYTPLVPTLKKIFTSDLARRGRDKKLLVFVATDGEPTDDEDNVNIPELERLMKETRQADTTYVTFLLCTDDPVSVGYLNQWDRTMQNIDVTDDYESEKKEIRRCRMQEDYPFSKGDHIVKALVGALIRRIDRLNEPSSLDNCVTSNT